MELESHTYSFRATLVGVHSFWHGRVNMFRCSEAVEKKERKESSGVDLETFCFLLFIIYFFILEKNVTRLRTESASEHSLLLVTAVTRHRHHWSFFFFFWILMKMTEKTTKGTGETNGCGGLRRRFLFCNSQK